MKAIKIAEKYGDKICPLLREPCIGTYCVWFVSRDLPDNTVFDVCAVKVPAVLALQNKNTMPES